MRWAWKKTLTLGERGRKSDKGVLGDAVRVSGSCYRHVLEENLSLINDKHWVRTQRRCGMEWGWVT